MSSRPTIRRFVELDELIRVEDLQREVWGFSDLDIVPARLMRVSCKSGALVLGAEDEEGQLVAFAYGFPGMSDGRPIFCSHMLAVLPSLRNQGLGRRLKLAQREWLLDQGLDTVTWTFDPLETKNGYLNLTKLGARSSQYIVNLYGQSSSPLHEGLDTDRFLVRWEIRSDRVSQRVDEFFDTAAHCGRTWERVPLSRAVTESRLGDDGRRYLTSIDLERAEPELLVESPWDASLFRREDVAEGRRWQTELRKVFQGYFSRGYELKEAIPRVESTGERRGFYLLSRSAKN